MIRTITIDDVPQTWIFEKYCNLKERLHGQDIRMHSMFTQEKTPSMYIYFKDNIYKFKDFSSGKQGTAIDLVKNLYGINNLEAINKIIEDYGKIPKDYSEEKLKPESKFKVTSHIKRQWNILDQKYWQQFGIGSDTLEKYNVFPLYSFVMSKDVNGKILEIENKKNYIYGYFKSDGTIAKIYMPKSKSLKFINVSRYIQGSDQLLYKSPTLIICSSLKDGMSMIEMGLNIEFIAPNSENSMISKSHFSAYILKYRNIVTLFDNDNAGHKAMEKYKQEYGIPGIYLNLSKDVSDSVKDFGQNITKNLLKTLLPK